MDLELYRINAQLSKDNEALKAAVEALAHENERLRAALESCYKLHPYLEKGIGASDTPLDESADK